MTLDDLSQEEQLVPGGVQGVDLAKVVERVKELLRENEELGEMILEAGKSGAAEYEKTLDGESASFAFSELQIQRR